MSVVNFTGVTRLDLPPNKILQEAIDANLESVFVIGYTSSEELYMSSSKADGGELLWIIERAKHHLMLIADNLEE